MYASCKPHVLEVTICVTFVNCMCSQEEYVQRLVNPTKYDEDQGFAPESADDAATRIEEKQGTASIS